MKQATFNIILLATPIVIGGLIAAINANGINDTTEKVEAWSRKRQQRASLSSGWFASYIINPVLWVIVKFCDWTDGFTHRGLKNGIRIAATLYLIAAWLFILYVALMIAVGIVITIAILYVVFKVLSNINDTQGNGNPAGKNSVRKKSITSIFSTAKECTRCGSKNHATSDCPHGLFTSECGRCGSNGHATKDCPHGLFTSECGRCGSKGHATSDCPHGLFASECGRCRSKGHATNDCPHGLFASKCGRCGSNDHATNDCPH